MKQEKKRNKNKDKIICIVLTCLSVCIGVFTIHLWNLNREPHVETGYAMGSVMQQTLYGKSAESAANEAMLSVLATEALISYREEDSDICKINNSSGKNIKINDRTKEILDVCIEVANDSKGAFDPTVLPISLLWNFDADEHKIPLKEEIEKFLPFVSWKNIKMIDNEVSLLKKGAAIDLGAAGKGAACDDAIKIYKKYGLSGAVVSVGGSIGVYANKPSRSDWKVAIRDPAGEISDILGILTVSDCFVSTSGSYEKCFTVDSVLYHHILDTKTGAPVSNDLVSVTIVAQSGILSDVLSTACFALGIEKSGELLNKYGASAIFVDKDNKVSVFGEIKFELTSEKYALAE